MKIALLHYSSYPVIGGVETVVRHQAHLLARHGHAVTILCGQGKPCGGGVRVCTVPALRSRNQSAELPPKGTARDKWVARFFKRVDAARAAFATFLAPFDATIVHNVLTMPFNLVATHALARSAAAGGLIIAWTHDLAALNPDYQIPVHPVFDVLRTRQPAVRYVAVSKVRAREFAVLTGTPADAVIPNRLDPALTLGLTPEVNALLGPLAAEAALLLCPTRILRRKNLGLALNILAAVRSLDFPAKLIVTGAVNPHGSLDVNHLEELKRQAEELAVTNDVLWLSEHWPVTERQLRSVYLLADAVLYPSRQEGFGLPPLEAAAFRLPLFCADLEPFRDHLPFNSVRFDLNASPRNTAERLIRALQDDKAYLSRKRLLREHSAGIAYARQIEPLLRK
ncbi:MAG TPA: glycosyltransferase family 4 protein [Chthoniobacterales bacterium]